MSRWELFIVSPFSPDGSRLAAASEDGSVKVWEAATGEDLLKLPRLSGLYDIAYLADGTFATAGQDGVARVWDSESGQELLTLAGPSSTVDQRGRQPGWKTDCYRRL